MKRLFCWLLLLLSSFSAYSQFATVQDGDWNDPNTWGTVSSPTSADGTIQVNHAVTIPTGLSLSVDQTTISATGTLIIDGSLTIINGTGTDFTVSNTSPLTVQITGTGFLILGNGATHSGFTATNTSFDAGSNYEHEFTTAEGVIPLATWDPTSILNITGYTTFTTATAAGNWGQTFGYVRWSCAAQTGTANLGGRFTTVAGNLDIENTNSGVLALGTTQTFTLIIAGNMSISGTSSVDLITTGIATVTIGGSFSMDAPLRSLRAPSGGAAGVGTLNIGGDFDLVNGIIQENGSGTAQCNINFVGTNASHLFTNAGLILNLLNYSVAATNTVTLTGESQMRGNANSTLTVNGVLRVESTAASGAIQTGVGAGAGNIRVTTRTYNSGSSIVYAGANPTPSAQFIGNGHPTTTGVTTYIDNSAGVSIVATTTIGDDLIVLNGNMAAPFNLTVNGDVDLQGGDLTLSSTSNQRAFILNGNLGLNGGDLNVSSGTTNATVTFNGDVTGSNSITFAGINSNVIINGTGAMSVGFPIAPSTSMEALLINRTSGSVVFPEDLTVTTTTTITTGDITFNGVTTLGTTAAQGITVNGGSATFNNIFTTSGDITLNAGFIDLNGAATIGDDVTLATGTTLSFQGQTLTLSSQFTSTGGVLSSDNTSILNVSGSGVLGTLVFSGSGNALSTLTLNRATGGTLITLNSALTIKDALTLTDGDFLNTSGLAMSSGALITRNSNANFAVGSIAPTGGPYNVLFNGTGPLTTSVELGGSITNVTTTNTNTVTLGSALVLTNQLLISAGTWASGANTISTASLNNASIFTAPSSTLTVTGIITSTGTFNANAGTVIFDGTSSIVGSPIFNNITINNLRTLTAPTTLSLTGNFTNNGTFTAASGTTVVFSGNTAKQIAGTPATTFQNISLAGGTAGTDLTITTSQNLVGVLTISNGTAVLDADGAGAAVFTLLSTADSPTIDAGIASIPTGSSITGNITAQRFMTLEGSLSSNQIWRNIGSPVGAATVSDLQNELPVTGTFTGATGGLTTNPSLFIYNENVTTDTDGSTVNDLDDGFVSYPVASNTETFAVGRGYSAFIFGAYAPLLNQTNARWDLRGTVNAGNLSLPVTFTSTGVLTNDGWNLVSNPYPSTINWTLLSRGNMDNAIYFEDYSTGDYVIASYVNGVGTNGGTNLLAMGQGFWVKANAASPTLSITESAKVAGTQTTFFRVGSDQPEILRIALNRGADKDETVIRLHNEATAGFDSELDAWKMRNPYWYINVSSAIESSDKDLSINSVKLESCSKNIDLLVTGISGSYSLQFSDFESIRTDVALTLVDNLNGTRTNIRQGQVYSFSVDENDAPTYYQRFEVELAFADEAVTLHAEPVNSCEILTAAVKVNDSSPDLIYGLYTADGTTQILNNITGDGTDKKLSIPAPFLNLGINEYLVKASNRYCSDIGTSVVVPVEFVNKPAAPAIANAQSCNGSPVTLSASNEVGVVSNKWYNTNGTEIQNDGQSSLEVTISANEVYYVTAINAIGCESEKSPVQASIIEDATISVIDPYTLKSNYETGNQWFFNGEKIVGETASTLTVINSGLYTLNVSVGTCMKSAELTFVITGTEGESAGEQISFSPNPVKNVLSVKVNSPLPVEGALYSITGQKVYDLNFSSTGNAWEAKQRIEGSSSLYLLKIVNDSKVSVIRIFKD